MFVFISLIPISDFYDSMIVVFWTKKTKISSSSKVFLVLVYLFDRTRLLVSFFIETLFLRLCVTVLYFSG